MAAFSEIDAVRSRHEATADITAPTVTAAELLKESRSRIDSLLSQLEGAETEEEREAIEAELRHERRHASRLAAQVTHLQRRADYSRVSLRIETGGKESSGGAWGIDDAFHDAGHVLTVVAAVTLIVLAILGPIALIALLAWLSHRAWVRRERRRVLS
jgi:Flp pilus assembly protein TadB